jgi:hypothetical protein
MIEEMEEGECREEEEEGCCQFSSPLSSSCSFFESLTR